MVKPIFWLSAMLMASTFAGQLLVIKSGVLQHQPVAVAGESDWGKLANAASLNVRVFNHE